ncbi:hypothetical protein BBF96_07035 [Anoxybacter fermentans]|uniref:YetF C-terminal domain-containing protein n=1 Tax=Anoxybacter fermentans TaxID=1323375 RepID=A0A3S9SXY2_9FIRM|nr:DUF421 domain-containing protein [Anoxybacter fermentans]AZR73159.1 hypothetical protein BBF96_07035 [Anoxybacter fermentans]
MSAYSEVFLRATFSFIILFFFTRVLAKKLISNLTYFDYIIGITIGTLAAALTIDLKSNPGPIFLALFLWTVYSLSLSFISLKFRKGRKIIEGEPTLLIQNGKILEENLSKLRLTLDDLMKQLREKNIFKVSDVEFALMETDGKISVLPKSQNRPVTPKDLNLDTKYEGLPTELIIDGKIIYQNLEQNNLDVQWLKDQLRAQQVNSVEEVNLAQLGTDGKLYIDLKSDNFQSINNPTD